MTPLAPSAVTTFRDLLDRAQTNLFADTFPPAGAFVKKARLDASGNERIYWYFRADGGKKDVYVGPESPELLDRIQKHKTMRADARMSRSLVNMLKVAGLPSPPPSVGAVLDALQKAGVFRHRVALVGTHAFGTYGGLLGIRLSRANVATADLDLAQFRDVSIAIAEDEKLDFFTALKKVDPSYRPLSPALGENKAVAYINDKREKVELLSPRQGPDEDAPIPLPSVGSHAQGLRHMDYLIRELVPSVVLHGPGIVVNVPAPERYAIHKLIVAERRSADSAKAAKDIDQATTLIEAMWSYQQGDVIDAMREAAERGPRWREMLEAGLTKTKLNEDIKASLQDVIAASMTVPSRPAP